MNAYAPTDWFSALVILLSLPLVLLLGLTVIRIRNQILARSIAWTLVAAAVLGIERFTQGQPAGVRMLAIIGVLLYAMKTVVTVELRDDEKSQLTGWQWLAFAGLWVGMRPMIFSKLPRHARAGVTWFAWCGVRNLLLGAVLVLMARGLSVGTESLTWAATNPSLRAGLVSAVLLPGLSLMLHFGVFHWLVAFWRRWGVECDPIFNQPLMSQSLTEFWGKRWNRAFSEMTSLAVYRPVRTAGGNSLAVVAAFVFSGVLHELAISVPVQANYGLPTLYFVVHGIGIVIENRWAVFRSIIQPNPWLARLWTFAWIIVPLPILFHPPFLRGCIWPLIGMEL